MPAPDGWSSWLVIAAGPRGWSSRLDTVAWHPGRLKASLGGEWEGHTGAVMREALRRPAIRACHPPWKRVQAELYQLDRLPP